MKKMIFLLPAFAAALSLAACLATPERALVVPKDGERMIEMARADQSERTEAAISNPDDPAGSPLKIDSSYATSFYGTTHDFTVRVNAELDVPDVAELPIVRVYAGEFDAETANRFYHLLCGGAEMYLREQFDTKPILEREIMKVMQMIESGEDTDGYLSDFYLKQLQKKYENAPDESGAPIRDVEYQEKISQGLIWESFDVFSQDPRGVVDWKGKHFSAQTSRKESAKAEVGAQSDSGIVYYDSGVYPVGDPRIVADVTGGTAAPEGCNLAMTPAEAQRQAERLLRDAGVTDMRARAVYLASNVYKFGPGSDPDPRWTADPAKAQYTYIVIFRRSVNGVDVVSPSPWISTSGMGEDGAPEWWYERLEVQLDENGVSCFYWKAPHTVGEVVVENAKLLPFGEIADIFTTMIRVKNEAFVIDDYYQMAFMTIDIDRITLTLQRVREQDSIAAGLLVPVWNFWGTLTRVYDDGTTVREATIGEQTEAASLLSVNAVDGSIVDWHRGY